MLAYMKNLGDNSYQVTIYISNAHPWRDSEIQIWPGRGTGTRVDPSNATLTGDYTGMQARNWGLFNGAGVNGYFRITIDISNGWSSATINFERLN
jgi:hypothetical protein